MAERLTHIRKIVDREALVAGMELARTRGHSVVHCHGCFDIVHPGHIRYLEFASRQADLLVVTLTSDEQIDKGTDRPYIPQELRAENLAALEFVDFVHIDSAETAVGVIEAIKPDVYVKGREYAVSADPRFLAERRAVEAGGGRVIFSSGEVIFSSTALLGALPRLAQLEAERLALVCRRHGIDRSNLNDLVERFSRLRIAVVGDVLIDEYEHCDALEVANESPILSLKRLQTHRFVGGAAIVARHAAALGAETVLITDLASRPATRQIEAVLADAGVELLAVRGRPAMVTKSRFLVESQKVLKVERGDVAPLDSQAETQVSAWLEQRSCDLDAVIVCDFGYGAITPQLLDRVLPCLRHNVPVLAGDVSGPRGHLLQLRHFDLLCPTERELRAALGDFDSGLSSAAWALMQRTQSRHLLCTLGKRGLVAFRRPSQDRTESEWEGRLLGEHLPSFVDLPRDPLGGGDALLTASTLALAGGGNLVTAAYLGNLAAAQLLGVLGNQPLAAAALIDEIDARVELSGGFRNALHVPVQRVPV